MDTVTVARALHDLLAQHIGEPFSEAETGAQFVIESITAPVRPQPPGDGDWCALKLASYGDDTTEGVCAVNIRPVQ